MARRALVLAGWVCSTIALTFAACDSDETTFFDDDADSGHAGEGGEATSSGGSGTSGTVATAGEGDGGSAARGGTQGGDTSRGGAAGRNGGSSGTSSGGSATGGSATGGTGGGNGTGGGSDGGAGGESTPEPVVCARIGVAPSMALAQRIALSYDRTRHSDCRVAWFETLFLPPIDKRAQYLNAIIQQTLVLWGCVGGTPSSFSLVYGEVPLSDAEVDALLELYLNASRIEAGLSIAEIAPIERALRELAEPLVDSSLDDFSRSRCPDGGSTGGSGGQGGMGGVAALPDF